MRIRYCSKATCAFFTHFEGSNWDCVALSMGSQRIGKRQKAPRRSARSSCYAEAALRTTANNTGISLFGSRMLSIESTSKCLRTNLSRVRRLYLMTCFGSEVEPRKWSNVHSDALVAQSVDCVGRDFQPVKVTEAVLAQMAKYSAGFTFDVQNRVAGRSEGAYERVLRGPDSRWVVPRIRTSTIPVRLRVAAVANIHGKVIEERKPVGNEIR